MPAPIADSLAASRLRYPLLVPVFGAIAVVALLPGLLAQAWDSATYTLVGERLLAGDIPYVDIWDQKPPGIYVLNALASAATGPLRPAVVSWGISVLIIALTGIVLAGTLRTLGWRWQAVVVAGLGVVELASFPFALGGGLTETVAVLPTALALSLALVGQMTAGRGAAAGILGGLGLSISLQTLPAFAAVAVAIYVRSRSIRSLAWFCVGAAAVAATVVGFLVATGSLAAAVEAIVGYNVVFSRMGGLDTPINVEALHALLVLSPLVVLAVMGLRRSLAEARLRPAVLGALVWIALDIAFVVIFQRRLELHYAGVLVVPLALLAPGGLGVLSTARMRPIWTGIGAGLLVVSAITATWLIVAETSLGLESRRQVAARVGAAAEWVRGHTREDESIFVWGAVPHVYLEAERAPASRWVYILPLLTPGYTDEKMIHDVLDEWSASPPAVIVDAGSSEPGAPGLPSLLIDRPTWVLDGRTLDMLDPLREFVRDHYDQALILEGWPIYVRQGNGT
jgi:hypothetical protein